MRSVVEDLARKLYRRWVPKWHHAFADNIYGGFYERIAEKFKPLDMGYKRLVTQCRQISIYSHASTVPESRNFAQDLEERFSFLVSSYHKDNGGWVFSVKDDGSPHDSHYDLYAHAFVIFTLSLYYRASYSEKAAQLAEQTLGFIDKNFRASKGFHEALDEDMSPIARIRRQNPHMHLLEACLFAYDTFGKDSYMNMADELYMLFQDIFYDQTTHTLGEFFTDTWKPHPDQGHIVEPGHHFEWVWLLQRYRVAKQSNDPEIIKTMRELLDWANTYGWDQTYGGIYNALNRKGEIVDDKKRIWPFAEGLKANAMMLDLVDDRDSIKDRTYEMIEVFRKKYILERGFWTEILNRDLSPASDYLPGTTPYHLYFGIVETQEYLKARGPSKSISNGFLGVIYATRRKLSSAVQLLKAKFNQSR